jgi:hypothetical protein
MTYLLALRLRLVGWLLVVTGVLLAADEGRQGVPNLVLVFNPPEYQQYLASTGGRAWFGWLPELALALALVLIGIWFTKGRWTRGILLLIIADLVVHAISGFFLGSTFVVETLIPVIHEVSIVGYTAGGVLLIAHKVISPAASRVFASAMFLIALGAVVSLASLAIIQLIESGNPATGSSESFLTFVIGVARNLLVVALEIVAGLLQAATGIVILVKYRSRIGTQGTASGLAEDSPLRASAVSGG